MSAATARVALDATDLGVVIITMNRGAELATTLDLLECVDTTPPTTVVIDNGSTDDTSEVLRQRAWVHAIALDRNLGGAARNLGVQALPSEFVAFVDDDTWPEAGAFERAVAFLRRHPDVAVVAAHVLVGAGDRVDPVCEAMAQGGLGRIEHGHLVAGFLAGASVVRASALREIGGFHPAFGVGGEEELVAWDLLDRGWQLAYLPDVVVHHHPSPRRDPTARAVREARNRIWSGWMRRSPGTAMRCTLGELRAAHRARTAVALTREMLRGVPMIVHQRRRLHASTELQLERVGA